MPFIETAYLGSDGADIFKDGDCIQHCGMIRVKVIGVGNLIPTLQSMQETETQVLNTIVMQTSAPNVAEELANFSQQRMALRLETTEINEVFRINRITFFVKPLWTSRPK